MDDTISRQAAIDGFAKAAREKFSLSDEFGHYLEGLGDADEVVRALPPAQPKNGKWEEIKVFPASEIQLQSARCSACKRYHTTPYLYNYTHYNFCPHCGARMVNEDDNNGTD